MSLPGEQVPKGNQEEVMDISDDNAEMLRQALVASLGAPGVNSFSLANGGPSFSGAPPPSVPLVSTPPPSVPLVSAQLAFS